MLSNLNKYDIVLASNSPRRRQLLGDLGLRFRIEIIKGIEENIPEGVPTELVPEHLAKQKAQVYSLGENELLITADTIVAVDGRILGKPADAGEAQAMLRLLSGRTHQVYTGVAITTRQRQQAFVDATEVEFAELTDEDINYYIERYKPLDKAGAYGIQEWIGLTGVKAIRGCFYNVMGLPLPRLYQELRRF